MGKNRIIKYTPAVTSVEECTNADTGVGAAIAAGSQVENGICALLVMAAIIIVVAINTLIEKDLKEKFQCPAINAHEIARINKASPIRLVKAVIIPALKDLLLL